MFVYFTVLVQINEFKLNLFQLDNFDVVLNIENYTRFDMKQNKYFKSQLVKVAKYHFVVLQEIETEFYWIARDWNWTSQDLTTAPLLSGYSACLVNRRSCVRIPLVPLFFNWYNFLLSNGENRIKRNVVEMHWEKMRFRKYVVRSFKVTQLLH